MVLSLLFSVGCSNSKRKTAKDEQSMEETVDDADFIVDAEDEELVTEDGETGEEVAVDEEEIAEVDEGGEPENVAKEAYENEEEIAPAQGIASAPVGPGVEIAGGVGQYRVKNGDTWMLIAFKIYGDYRRWRELRSFNNLGINLNTGDMIKYNRPAQEFVWSPNGLPYLIKRGDTLGTISVDKYGTAKKWRSIYNNNRPLIQDPNLIFAGFTIYYVPERDVASE